MECHSDGEGVERVGGGDVTLLSFETSNTQTKDFDCIHSLVLHIKTMSGMGSRGRRRREGGGGGVKQKDITFL